LEPENSRLSSNPSAAQVNPSEKGSAPEKDLVSEINAMSARIAQVDEGGMQASLKLKELNKGVSLVVEARTKRVPNECIEVLERALDAAYNNTLEAIAPKSIYRSVTPEEAFQNTCAQFETGTAPEEIQAKKYLFDFFSSFEKLDPLVPAYLAQEICIRGQSFVNFWKHYEKLNSNGFFNKPKEIGDFFVSWDQELPPHSKASRDLFLLKKEFGASGTQGTQPYNYEAALKRFAEICARHSNPKVLAQDPFTQTFLEASALNILNLNRNHVFSECNNGFIPEPLGPLLDCCSASNPVFVELVRSAGSDVLALLSNIATLGGRFIADKKGPLQFSRTHPNAHVQDAYSIVLPWLTDLFLCNSDSTNATNREAIGALVDSLVYGLKSRADDFLSQDRPRLLKELEEHRLQKLYASATKEQIPRFVDSYFERIGGSDGVPHSEEKHIENLLKKGSSQELVEIADSYRSQSPAKAVAFCSLAYAAKDKSCEPLAVIWSSSLQAVLEQFFTNNERADFSFLRKHTYGDNSTVANVTSAVDNFTRHVRSPDALFNFVQKGIADNRLILGIGSAKWLCSAIVLDVNSLDDLTTAQARKLFITQADALLSSETGMHDLRGKGAAYLEALSWYSKVDPAILDDSLRGKVSQFSKCISLLTPVATLLGKTGYEVAKKHAPSTIPLLVALEANPHSPLRFELSPEKWQIPAKLNLADRQYDCNNVAAEIKTQFPPARDGRKLADDDKYGALNYADAYAAWAAGQINNSTSAPPTRLENLITFTLEFNLPNKACQYFYAMRERLAGSEQPPLMLEHSLMEIATTAPNLFLRDFHKLTEGVNFSVGTLKTLLEKATTLADPTLALDFLHTFVDTDALLVKRVLPDILQRAGNLLTGTDDKKGLATPTRLLYGAVQLFHYLDRAEAQSTYENLLEYAGKYNLKFPGESCTLTLEALAKLREDMRNDEFTRDDPKTRLMRYPKVSKAEMHFFFHNSPAAKVESEGWLWGHFARAFIAGERYQDYVSKFSEVLKNKNNLGPHTSLNEFLNQRVSGAGCSWDQIFEFRGADMKFTPAFVSDWLTKRVKDELNGLWLHPQQRAYIEHCVSAVK
jgi:hypothetical protein